MGNGEGIRHAQLLLEELLQIQQHMEKSAFDTLNQSDTLLKLAKDGMTKMTELLSGMEAIEEEMAAFYSQNPPFSELCNAQGRIVGELGHIFQTLHDCAELFNEKSHENEELISVQRELMEKIQELVVQEEENA